MKICKLCNIKKELIQFNKNKAKKDNLDIYCKECVLNKSKKYRPIYIPLIAKDVINNKICFRCRIEKSKDEYSRCYKTKDGFISHCKKCNNERRNNSNWYKNQYDNIKDYKLDWTNNKYKNDLNYKLKSNIRCRMNHVLKEQYISKDNNSLKYLGCNLEEYKEYLEKQFIPEMNWSNHGEFWEIDHIIPCTSFDLTNEENIYKCFNYKNTQPLTVFENRSKGDKII